MSIPPSLGEGACDPGGVLDKLGMISPQDFWKWFHAADGPKGVWHGQMGQKWGEYWFEYLQTDPLVLAGAVPLVLQKRAQMTGVNEDRKIRISEFKALQRLRERLENLEPASIGGLVMTICGRVNINVQQNEYDLALMHLQAVRRLVDMQPSVGSTWICSVWTDLRVISSTDLPPVLARYVPDGWRPQVSIPSACVQASQRSAMLNMRSLSQVGSERFLLIHGILKRLHELETTTAVQTTQAEPPIETLYNTIYDCCVLDSECAVCPDGSPASTQTAVLAICLKLCAWEKASHFILRGGEIERNLLQRAKALLGDDPITLQPFARAPGGANSNAVLWMLFTLTSTAYMFQRDDLEGWIGRLRAISSVSTASAFQRALKGWPSAPWWWTHALRRICNELAPRKGQWRVLSDEPDPVPMFMTGLRLKLLVVNT